MCQLDALQGCLNLPTLRKALASLPKALDETYARILCNIPEDHSQDAIKILQWLTYSARPLRIEELAEIIAINITGEPWFDPDARFPDQREILKVCSSLVTLEEVASEDTRSDNATAEHVILDTLNEVFYDKVAQSVRLAHFSVKEYLTSDRIRDQQAARYTI